MMAVHPCRLHYFPLKPHKVHTSFPGVKASVRSTCRYCRLHSLQRTGALNIPGGDAAQKGKTILLRVILASVTLELISAASGWELVYISMTGPAPCVSVSVSVSISHTQQILDLDSQRLKFNPPTFQRAKWVVLIFMLNVTSFIHKKNICKESLTVFTLSDGYDGVGLSIFTWKTLLMSNWCSALERNKMVLHTSLQNPSQSFCIIILFCLISVLSFLRDSSESSQKGNESLFFLKRKKPQSCAAALEVLSLAIWQSWTSCAVAD